MKKIVSFIINPSELGAGTRGASLGPMAIVAASRSKESKVFKNCGWKVLPDYNHLLDRPIKYPFAKRIDGMVKVYHLVADAVATALEKNEFPYIIAGDHASAGGTIQGIHQAYPEKRIGVIWIDAHADIHTPYTTPSGNLHGMPLATAMGTDNLPCQRNAIDLNTSVLWNELKSGVVKPEDLVYVAVRDTEPEEDSYIEVKNIRKISVADVRKKGAAEIGSEILSFLSQCDILYVSFDVDAMDPYLTSHGTGTPVQNGLTPTEAIVLLEVLVKSPKTSVLEMVEINPCLDFGGNKMAEHALEIIEKLSQTLEEKEWN